MIPHWRLSKASLAALSPLLTLALVLSSAAPEGARAQGLTSGGEPPPTSPALPDAPPVEGPSTSLGLSEAIAIAVQSNLGIRAAALTPREAELGVMGAKGIYDPTLSSNIFGSQRGTPCSNSLECPEAEPLIYTSSLSLGLSLSQLTPLGGTVSLAATTARLVSSSAVFSYPGWITGAELSVSQPLLRGGGYRINRLDIERSLLEQDLSWEVLRGQVQDLIVDVHVAYFDLLSARRALELGRQSLEFAQKQGEITRERISLGLDAPVEIYAVEQTVASRQADVELSGNRVRTAEVNLRALLAWPIVGPGANVPLIPTDLPPDLDAPLEREAIYQEAVDRDPTLQRLKRQVDIRELEQLRARNGLLPTLNFQGSVGVNGSLALGDDADGAAAPDSGNLSQVWTAGLVLSTDLGWRQARASYGQAEINTTQAGLSLAEREQALALSVEQAVNAVETARVRVGLNAKARELADKTLEAERERLARGESTLKNVLDYLNLRDQARLTELGAQIELGNALIAVESLRGTLVPQFGVELETVGQAAGDTSMGGTGG